MKSFRLAITLLAAGLTAYSPVTLASMDLTRKASINRNTKYLATGTFNDLYNIHGNILSPEVRGHFEAWLQVHGKQKVPQPQAKMIKDKNGKDNLQLIMNHSGKALTVVFTDGNTETFTANGVQVKFSDLNHMSHIMAQLAAKDSSLKSLAKELQKEVAPVRNWSKVNSRHIAAVTPLQRVEFFALMRESVEAAQKVIEASNRPKKTSF